MVKYFLSAIIFMWLCACTTVKNTQQNKIAVTPLNNYKFIDTNKLRDEITYKFFTRESEFASYFQMTKSTTATAIIPDFSTHNIVAIIHQPTTKVISLNIEKARFRGGELSLFCSITDTTSWSTYEQINSAVALIPKLPNAQTVRFLLNNNKQYILKVNN